MPASLWDEINIGDLSLKNRAVMPAMGTGYGSGKGEVTERLKAYLKKRARGGVGLIITEICAVHPSGRGFASELGIYDDCFIPGLRELTGEVKAAGAAIAAQLHHAGRETFPQVIGEQPVAPSPIASRATGQKPRELTIAEIEELVRCFSRAAARAREAGFDAVEVHGAHGYLINQFISPYSNQREDEYGGDAEGRLRFAREVIRGIKEEAGGDFPVILRFSSAEEVRGGYDLDYILPMLPLLQRDGVDAFHVSCGVIDSPGNPTIPGLHYEEGINVKRAEAVKGALEKPVIVVGKIRDPRMAEDIISREKADMVAFGRQHIADPLFLRKASEGRYEDIRFCLGCNQGCIERMAFELKPITCSVNPECGEEWRERKDEPKNTGPFLVVGGGPAGLEAALTMGESGAEVELMERESELGGQLRPASRPEGKESFREWVDWAARRLNKLGVEVRLGEEASVESLGSGEHEGIVVATGAEPLIPEVEGREKRINAEAREVLLGLHEMGEKVLVVGAGPVGMETAQYLIQGGHQVTVVEEREYPPVSPLTSHGYFLHRTLRKKGELLLKTRLARITPEGAILQSDGVEKPVEVDSVVWAVGSAPERGIMQAAAETGIPFKAAGDVVEPRQLLEAVSEGYRAAMELLYPDMENQRRFDEEPNTGQE